MGWVLLIPLALAAGMALSTQFAVNTQLKNVVGGPVAAAAVSFLIGTVFLTVAALAVTRSMPTLGEITASPWWIWIGGLLGAFFVFASVVLTPRLGAATTVGLFLTGQVTASIILDHFGLLRIPVHEATLPRLAGAALIIVGVVLVQRF
ncbi:MAG TPA: DMT family transporter [Rubrobacteraceae bacterium]|nr:DMT family transporter [Rubrobacteraceae bacterium]